MKAVVIDRAGDPAEVLHIRDVPTPMPGPGEVRVRMLASPINPSDLLMVRGLYGFVPKLPATPGFEGVGIVDAAGAGLLGRFRVGSRVAVLNGVSGNWAEYAVVPAKQVVPVASQLSDEQAASFFVNPATVLAMIRWVLRVPRGAWLLQDAAGSALGRMVIRLGRRDGFRTVNVVRRREQVEELNRLGADAVICSADESIEERVPAITGSNGAPYGLDCVGGDTGSALLRALAPSGRLLVYGTMSLQPVAVDPRSLIAEGKRVEGFWLSTWAKKQNVMTMLRLFRQINKLLCDGTLTSDVGGVFPLERIQEAARQADTPGKAGKVVLRIGPAD